MFKNPIFLGPGVFDLETNKKAYESCGAIFTKTVSKEPRTGNLGKIFDIQGENTYNRVGLTNEGIKDFCDTTYPKLTKFGNPVFVSVLINKSLDDLDFCLRNLQKVEPFGIELNYSCPNIKSVYPSSFQAELELCKLLLPKTKTSLKMPPSLQECLQTLSKIDISYLDFITVSNTLPVSRLSEKMDPENWGFSGKVLLENNCRIIHALKDKYRESLKIIGLGGIRNIRDVATYELFGADFFSIVSAEMIESGSLPKIIKEMR